MKTLYESLLDDFEKLEDSIDPIDAIKKFLNDNYLKYNLKISKKPNKDGLYEVDCRSSSYIEVKNKEIESLTNGMFEFTNIKNFYCMDCKNLTSLEGAPKKCNFFNCSGCINLTSLEGAPKEVGIFCCFDCDNLTSLKGAPKEVKSRFDCSHCNNLTSLEGAPKEVKGIFNCSHCVNLTSLKGAPKEVESNFHCAGCINLTSLKGAPKKVGVDFYCTNCATTFTEQDVKDICDVKGTIHT